MPTKSAVTINCIKIRIFDPDEFIECRKTYKDEKIRKKDSCILKPVMKGANMNYIYPCRRPVGIDKNVTSQKIKPFCIK